MICTDRVGRSLPYESRDEHGDKGFSLAGRVRHRRNPTSPAVSDYAPLIRPTTGAI